MNSLLVDDISFWISVNNSFILWNDFNVITLIIGLYGISSRLLFISSLLNFGASGVSILWKLAWDYGASWINAGLYVYIGNC